MFCGNMVPMLVFAADSYVQRRGWIGSSLMLRRTTALFKCCSDGEPIKCIPRLDFGYFKLVVREILVDIFVDEVD